MQSMMLNKRFFLGCVLLAGCGSMPCEDTLKSEVESPVPAYVATVSERNCGATTNFSTMVSLRKKGTKFSPSEKARVLVVEGVHPIRIFWKGKDTLYVSRVSGEVFVKETNWNGVRIQFE